MKILGSIALSYRRVYIASFVMTLQGVEYSGAARFFTCCEA